MKTFARRERRADNIAASISSSQGWAPGGSSLEEGCSGVLGSQHNAPCSFPVDAPEKFQAGCQPKRQSKTSRPQSNPSVTQPTPSRLSGTSRRVYFASEQPKGNLKQPLKRQPQGPTNEKQPKRRKTLPASQAGSAASRSAAQLPCHATAITVLEAQESGAHAQMVDDALYALDGLVPEGGSQALTDSTACLASIAASRRGLLALKSEGIIERCFIAAQELPITKHLDLALCFATLILACSLHDAAALTHPAALATIQRLLHADCSPLANAPTGSKPPSKLIALLSGSGPMGRAAPPPPHTLHPPAILLTALSSALHPSRASGYVEELRAGLCGHGALEAVACLALHQVALLSPSADPGQLWILCSCLTVLENASSASPSTEEHLIGIRLLQAAATSQASHGPAKIEGLEQDMTTTPEMLVRCIASLASSTVEPKLHNDADTARAPASGAAFLPDSQGTSSSSSQLIEWVPARSNLQWELRSDCLHAALSALMNLTHNNETGCRMAAEAGGLKAAAGLLTALARPQLSSSEPVTGQPPRRLAMTGAQLIDSQTSASGTAAAQADKPPPANLHIACADGGQALCSALPAASPTSASLENLLREADLVSVALGLLINLAEASRSSCRRLLGLPPTHTTATPTQTACSGLDNAKLEQPTCLPSITGSRQQDVPADPEATESLLPLLCLLTQHAAVERAQSPDANGRPGCNDVTEEELARHEADREAAKVGMYAAVLLAFLLQAEPGLQQTAAALLGGSLQALLCSVSECLEFYVGCRAIMARNQANLQTLLADLKPS